MTKVFPELKESEDERIIRELIKFLQECHNIDSGFFTSYFKVPYEQMIAWLEKQGETFTNRDVDGVYLKGIYVAKHELETQTEQKPDWSGKDEISIAYRIGFADGEAHAREEMIDKACEWWKEELEYPSMTTEEVRWYKNKIRAFRKAMEKE